jgi:hypothetical protein
MDCQACGSEALTDVFRVDRVPVHSCMMVSSRQQALDFPRGDLRVQFCEDCGFLQNSAFRADLIHYSTDYEETQAFSSTFRAFQTRLCQDQVAKHGLQGKSALEIGCGKGEFISELCEISGGPGIGIDPGYRPERNESEAANRIEFIQDLYSPAYKHLKADYVACRHTLEHIQPVREFVQMVRDTLDEATDTVVFFELPGGERVLREMAFWDIYHEHCTYFTLGSLARLFRRCGFEILDLYTGYDDQYLMIEARPGDPNGGKRFEAEQDLEQIRADVEAFRGGIEAKLKGLSDQLDEWVQAGKKVALWGSGSKAVSYLTTLGVTDQLQYVVDINPHKHGKFLAGSGHEIVSPEFLVEYQPDAVIVMNPIYLEEIRADLVRMGLEPESWAV